MAVGDGEVAFLDRVDLASVLDGLEVELVGARGWLGDWRLVAWGDWLVLHGASALPVLVEVPLACGQLLF